MVWVAVGFSLIALLVAVRSLLGTREAMQEAKSPRMEALVVEYQQILDEWLEKQNAVHARAMKRLKAQRRLLEAQAPAGGPDPSGNGVQPAGGELEPGVEPPGGLTKADLRARVRQMAGR